MQETLAPLAINRRTGSIRSRLVLLVMAVMLPMIGLGSWYIVSDAQEAREAAFARVNLIVQGVATNVDQALKHHETLLKALAKEYRETDNGRPFGLNAVQFVHLHPQVAQMGMRDLKGKSLYSTQTAPVPAPEFLALPWAQDALERDSLGVSNAVLEAATQRWVAVITYPLHSASGVRVGFVYLTVDLAELNTRIMHTVPGNVVVPVFDRTDHFLLRSIDPQVWIGKPLPAPLAQTILGRTEGVFTLPDIKGVMRLYAVATIPRTGWRVFAGVPEAEVLATAGAKRNTSIVLMVLTLFGALVLAWWRASEITTSIGALAITARNIAHGQSERAQESGPTEVAQVARHFNHMLDTLARHREEREALTSHYGTLLRNARDMILLVNTDGLVVDANNAALEAYGYTLEEIQKLSVADLRAPQARQAIQQDWQATGNTRGVLFETLHQCKDGRLMDVEVSARAIDIEGKPYRQSFIRDISARKKTEVALRHRNRALEVLSQANSALIRSRSEGDLLNHICRLMVDAGGYRMAWIGFASDDAEKSVRPVAHYGIEPDYLKALHISWADAPHGHGPTGEAIRTQQTVVSQNLRTNPFYAPWRDQATKYGYSASIALPLNIDGQISGALNVYAAEADAFDPAEVLLLEQLAGDLTYGLVALRTDAARQQLQSDLVASEERFRLMIEGSPAGVFIVRSGRFVYANPRLEEILGYPSGGLVGVGSLELVAPEDIPAVHKAMEIMGVRGSSGNFSVHSKRRDGTVIELGIQDVRVSYQGTPAIMGMAQDISERSQAQAEIQRYIALLEHTTESTLQAVSAMVEQRDPYTAGHERRVGELAAAIGAEMGMSEHATKGLRLTGYVHDIGKIAVPAELLAKPTRLTHIEMELIKVHAQAGYDVLKNVEFPWPVAQVILQHHERMDGSGYPQGLAGDAILMEARIMMVADVVESMSSHRPYRAGLGIEAALSEITSNSGRVYDATVVDACVRLFRDKGFVLSA